MDKVPVIVMRNKTNPSRYLAAGLEYGDWDDENLDVTMEDIKNAYMIIRKDLSVPTKEDFIAHKNAEISIKNKLREQFGDGFFISLDFEKACEAYDPVNIEITKEQYDYAVEIME